MSCAVTYIIIVTPFSKQCQGIDSRPYNYLAVICPPTGVTGVTTCSNSNITVSWNPSPDKAADYFISSQGSNGTSANYTTSAASRVLSGLQCGDLFTFKVAARNSDCASFFSQPIQTKTAPCPPTNLTVKTECGTNRAILSWAPSKYALSYTATFTGVSGQVVSCSTNTTTCSVKLDCGNQFSAVVVASTETCNSSASAALGFRSAPCLPNQVQAVLNCSTNSFAVQWKGDSGVIMYKAIAIGSDNSSATCDTNSTKCTIKNLKCGLLYSIVVTTSSVDCGTIQGSDYFMYSGSKSIM
ncbi:fibronectin type III domain-containing protein 7-like [Nothobranchius furzeri]|uniref:Fibronectin type III domain-containing protein 7-like n=1 Tax=Nothobranchius furzeri TaxID=105023 RepID=A0A9D3BCR7_NOTFU|nr:fibronectin type III domain-containing protein 7-like [Nothobranchius furzeri]